MDWAWKWLSLHMVRQIERERSALSLRKEKPWWNMCCAQRKRESKYRWRLLNSKPLHMSVMVCVSVTYIDLFMRAFERLAYNAHKDSYEKWPQLSKCLNYYHGWKYGLYLSTEPYYEFTFSYYYPCDRFISYEHLL